jgi:hypothetical protein
MRKDRFFALSVGMFALLLVVLFIGERVLARGNGNGARLTGLNVYRATFHTSQQVLQTQNKQKGATSRSCRVLISVDPCAAKTSRSGNGCRIVIGPHPVVQEAARTARARHWQQYK